MATSSLTARAVPAAPARAATPVRAWLAAAIALAIAAYFWIDSRYPALLKKLHSGKAIHLSGSLSFDALLPVTAQMPIWTRIAYTAVDWAWTNRIGMTFGVFFGAALLTLLNYLPRRRFSSDYTNTALGAAIGAPLGVCANCVAPIGRGMLQGGTSPATALAAMIASPTLNVVALIMAFTLLPLPIALLRLATPLLLLALVPLLVRSRTPLPISEPFCPIQSRPSRAALDVVKAYFVNLGRLALSTVPWMLAAGLLGAIVIELIPAQLIPAHVTFLGIVAVALLGTFAPMPIAFDVAFAWILLSHGVPAPYVAILACTLGAFSIYPFVIVGKSLSWPVALKVYAAVTTVGILAGVIAAMV